MRDTRSWSSSGRLPGERPEPAQRGPRGLRHLRATANAVEVIVAQTDLGRGILGVIDGDVPLGVETDEDVDRRKRLLRPLATSSDPTGTKASLAPRKLLHAGVAESRRPRCTNHGRGQSRSSSPKTMTSRADAGLSGPSEDLRGWGRSRRNPTDPDLPAVGEEVAAARALTDLAHHLLEAAAHRIESWEGHPVELTR